MKTSRYAVVIACALCLGGCEKAMRNMYDQPRYKPLQASPLFADGNSARPLPAGSVVHSRGSFAATSSGREGEAEAMQRDAARAARENPYRITTELLARGRERHAIYCAPCHSPLGDGEGRIAQRGFPHPPTYHQDRLRAAPDRHFFDVMSEGYGVMYSVADRVAPSDRWAIVAYIRTLQRSQHATLDDVPEAQRREWEKARP